MLFQGNDIAWHSPAGQVLDQFARRLKVGRRLEIVVFGSTPLQLLVDPKFLSADIDICGDEETYRNLLKFAEGDEWSGDNASEIYIQICDPLAFRSTVDWRSRAIEVERHGHLFVFVHPWDVLVSKLQRLEEKDINAFRLVIEKTGHPSEEEFANHLQLAVDLFRPRFDEETERGDMTVNTRFLWQALWNKEIDVRARIIRPALERAEREYRVQDSGLKRRLGDLRYPPPGDGH